MFLAENLLGAELDYTEQFTFGNLRSEGSHPFAMC